MTADHDLFDGLLRLESVGQDRFRGRTRPGTGTRAFGGHLLAQAVRASATTHAAGRPVNSLHAYFVGAARAETEIDYAVDSLKRGRSFDIDHVVARQHGRSVMTCTVSFHAQEEGADFQIEMPQVAQPTALRPDPHLPLGRQPSVRDPFELRHTQEPPRRGPAPDEANRLYTWLRTRRPVPSAGTDDHVAMLAYAVDFLITRAAHVAVPDDVLDGASLDHAMWFHRPFRIDEWLLISCSASTLVGARSLSRAQIFDRDGRLVATAVQEGLLRVITASN